MSTLAQQNNRLKKLAKHITNNTYLISSISFFIDVTGDVKIKSEENFEAV